MINRDEAEKLVALMGEIGTNLENAAKIVKDATNGEGDEHATYLATIEFVTGYLKQDVMQPIFIDYPDLAPDDCETV